MIDKKKTPRPYYDLARLVAIYRAVEEYRQQHGGDNPSMLDIVKLGLASTPGMVSYYYRHMQRMGMIGRTFHRSRSVQLRPLEEADPAILEHLKKEKE